MAIPLVQLFVVTIIIIGSPSHVPGLSPPVELPPVVELLLELDPPQLIDCQVDVMVPLSQ